MSEARHLWDIKHPYYCEDTNFSGRDKNGEEFKSWSEFMASNGDADPDYNLVFRFDWREGEGWNLTEFNGDVNYRNGEVMICWMGQRHGIYRWSKVAVCRADEPAVLAFLRPRWDHMRRLWEGVSE